MMSEDKAVVLVTLDIGDTYSGFAYTYRADFDKDKWKVQMNDPWMREKHATNKTSSALLLKPHGKVEGMLFGYRAEADFNEKFLDGEHKELMLFKNVKREFYKNDITIDTTIIDSNSEKEKLLIDVMLLMIQYLKGQAVERIQKRFPDLEMKDFYWVITVPALWSDQTVIMYRDLIIESGISYRRLKIVTEQDAAMAYGMQYLKIKESFKERNRICKLVSMFDAKVMVLDIGGNATTITVHRVDGDKTFKTIFKSRSQNKGGNQVNEKFHLLLSNILGENIINILKTDYCDDYQNLCVEFEMRKRELHPDTPNHEWFNFTFPHQVVETFRDTHGKKTIHQRITEMSNYSGRVKYESSRFYVEAGILRELFSVVIDQIESYVRNVLKAKINTGVATLLLAGGFCQSPVVQKGIRDRFPDMEVIVPLDPELAIMKGAMKDNEIRPPTPEDGNFLKTREKTQLILQRQKTVMEQVAKGYKARPGTTSRPGTSSSMVSWFQERLGRSQSEVANEENTGGQAGESKSDNRKSVACEIM